MTPTITWRMTKPGVPRRGLDTAVFGEALMEYLCAATGHWNACGLLNSRRAPWTGRLFFYFADQAEKRKGRLIPLPIQSTFTSAS